MLKHQSFIQLSLASLMTLITVMGTSQLGFAMDQEERGIPYLRTAPLNSEERETCRKLAVEHDLGEDDQILQAIWGLGESRADLLKRAQKESFFRLFDEDFSFCSSEDPTVKNIPPSMSKREALECLNSIKDFGDDLDPTLVNLNCLAGTYLFPVFKEEFRGVARAAKQIGSFNTEGDVANIIDRFFVKFNLTRIFPDEFLFLVDAVAAFGKGASLSLLEDFDALKILYVNENYSHFFQDLDEFCKHRLGSSWKLREFDDRPYKALSLDDSFIENYLKSFVPICLSYQLDPIDRSQKEDRRHRALLHEFVIRPEAREKTVRIARKVFGDDSISANFIKSSASGLAYYQEVDAWLQRTPPFSLQGKWPQIGEFTAYPRDAFLRAVEFVERNKINERWNNCNFARDQLKSIMRFIDQQKRLPKMDEINAWLERDKASNKVSKETVTTGINTYF